MDDKELQELTKEAEAVEMLWRAAAAEDFLEFCNGLTVPGAAGPCIFEDLMAAFQREFFESIAPCVHALVEGAMPPRRRFWLERTKKASKDSDLAIIVCWIIAFCKRPILVQVCAASSEQAGIIENRVRSILHYNTWLNEHIEVVERKIRKRSDPNTIVCQIEATGSAGAAQGPTPDLLILNELVHVDKWSVMETHMNNADGVPQGIVIVSTNAGIKGSAAWAWREAAIFSDRWHTFFWSEPAPWLNAEDIEDAKKRDIIGTEYARLWTGRWVSGAGDAVGEDILEAAFRMKGVVFGPQEDWLYIAGLDLGVSHDHAGIAVVGIHPRQQRVQVSSAKRFFPNTKIGNKHEVDLILTERYTLEMCKRFRVRCLHYDPNAGGSYMAQRLRKAGIVCMEQSFKPAGMTAMAEAYVTLMKSYMLECYDDPENALKSDFAKFSIEHRPPSNYKLVAISDSTGHADVGTAVVMCLPHAINMLGGYASLLKSDVIASTDDTELSEQEIDELPDEFKDLIDLYDGYSKQDRDFTY